MIKEIVGIGTVEILDSESAMTNEVNKVLAEKPFNVDLNKTIRQIEDEFVSTYPQLNGEWFPLFEFKYSGSFIYAADKDLVLCETMEDLKSCGIKMRIGRIVQSAA